MKSSTMKRFAGFILFIILFCSCQPNLDYEIKGYKQKIIVEGEIANNEFPKVYLSLNIPLSEKTDSITILENVIRWAKVTVSDGVDSEILTGYWDLKHFPPYVYRGIKLKGEEGKTYYLTVEYGGYTLQAVTTIPVATEIQKFNTTAVPGSDILRILSMTINIDSTRKNAYRVFTKKKKDGYYIQTQFVYNSEFTLSGNNTFVISPKTSEIDSSYNEGSYFVKGDSVQVQLCTIDSVSTQFYKALTLFSSTTGFGNNFFIGEKDALKSNISLPGFGIWCGTGVTNYSYIIP